MQESMFLEEMARPKTAKIVWTDVSGRRRRKKLRGDSAHIVAVMAYVDQLKMEGSVDIKAFYQ